MRRSPGQRGPQVISSCLLLSGFIDRRAADQPDANEVFSIIVDYLRHVNRTRKRKRRTVVRRTAVFKARSEEHTSDLQSLMRISYAVFCLKKKKNRKN